MLYWVQYRFPFLMSTSPASSIVWETTLFYYFYKIPLFILFRFFPFEIRIWRYSQFLFYSLIRLSALTILNCLSVFNLWLNWVQRSERCRPHLWPHNEYYMNMKFTIALDKPSNPAQHLHCKRIKWNNPKERYFLLEIDELINMLLSAWSR